MRPENKFIDTRTGGTPSTVNGPLEVRCALRRSVRGAEVRQDRATQEAARIAMQKARTVARDYGFPEVAEEQLELCRQDPGAYARKMAAHEDIPLAYGDVQAVLACRREGASSTLRPPPRGGADTGYSADAVVAAPRAGPPERRPAPEGGGTEQEEGQCSSDRDQTSTSRSGMTLKRTKHFDQE